jgi:peptidoglycan hydrolase-like protein with peptidoglycan-binding domain
MPTLLKRGSRGAAVKSLQQELNSVLRPSPGLSPDGVFGPKTESAVKAFQRQVGITVDGIVGPNTRQRLATSRPPVSQSNALRLGSRGPEVKRLQQLLNQKSPAGPRLAADGVFGARTQRAVQNYQRHASLAVDGVAGQQTFGSLESAPNAPRRPLDPPVVPTPQVPVGGGSHNRPYYSGIVEAYGDPEDWGYIKRFTAPFTLMYGDQPVRTLSAHQNVGQSLIDALGQVLSHYGMEQIESLRINQNYGGLVNKRKMRGGSQWSTHSWGVAIDLNHSENQLRWGADRALFAKPEYKPLLDIFESHGWYNLGRYKNYDFMHFQAVRI